MIVFDLKCSEGHGFEGWFNDTSSFEEQIHRNLLTCPVCGNNRVKKILSPVATRSSRCEISDKPEAPSIDYRKLAAEVVEYINKGFEDVGSEFTKEALKMHYGVREKRSIRGSATREEEKTLQKEKIEFFKIPFPAEEKDTKN
ncbi:MAG: DUF1178 family protein [Desulfatiglandales bacterium]